MLLNALMDTLGDGTGYIYKIREAKVKVDMALPQMLEITFPLLLSRKKKRDAGKRMLLSFFFLLVNFECISLEQ